MSNPADVFEPVALRLAPPLDPGFQPASLVNRAFRADARATGAAVPVRFALEQADGSVFQHATVIYPDSHPRAAANTRHVERLVKFFLWSRGGYRILVDGPASLVDHLEWHFASTATGHFDARLMGEQVYERPFVVVAAKELPPERSVTQPLGRHLEGCRIGFDLGGSDRKVAAVVDGQVVFSEETVWDPYPQTDPQFHFDGIMDSLRQAAAHLPRVDAIGGSAAGVYVNNQVKVASLFRGVPAPLFQSRVKGMFGEIQRAWKGVPLEVVNDGEVTALAGAMALRRNSVLGIALGTSQAAGYVNAEGNITTWLNELAFTPVDYRREAPRDEWSGDIGCGVQYFSQQAVGRLLAPAGITVSEGLPLPEKLKVVQKLMADGDARARRIYETVGIYLGYSVAHYAEFYDLRNVLVLGRVTSGPGGEIILAWARAVLRVEFPELAEQVDFHTPSEQEKRHGQAIAAASLPRLRPANQ